MGKRTPWGTSQHETTYAPGVVFHGTAGHGGFHLDRSHNALVHEAWREAGGWYEEDCDWVVVALTFPAIFPAETVEHARTQAKNERPDEYTAVTGTPLTLEESAELRKRVWRAAHAKDYVVTAAWGDWQTGVPEGAVGVHAYRGGRLPNGLYASEDSAYFLVPADEYDARDGEFIVDETRHARVDSFAANRPKPRKTTGAASASSTEGTAA
jgi:uncharacterized protein DUF7007